MANTQVKYFFHRHKRLLITLCSCALAIALICIVAVKSAEIARDEDYLQTTNPSNITFVMPVKDGVVIKDFSNTALKYNSTLKQWEAHKAVDIKGADNADVYACYAGEILSIENDYLKGTVVTIKHSNSLQTVYASLDENVNVEVGDKVNAGDIIGKVSTSAKGESNDGAHLHFEVLLDGVKTDPNLYLENSNK